MPGKSKKFMRLAGYGLKSIRPIFKTKMFIYQSTANLDVKILSGKITHIIYLEISKMLERGLYGNQDSTVLSGP